MMNPGMGGLPQDPSQGGGVDPQMIQQLLAQLSGGQGGPPSLPTDQPDQGGDWLTTAINAVHGGMVQEKSPEIVSLLGAILNQLTTAQQKIMSEPGKSQGG